MAYPQPETVWRQAANFTNGRNGNPVRHITFHHVVGSAASAVAAFSNPARQASAHFIVGADVIYCMVDTDNTAWCNGNWQSNLESVAIEHEGTWLNGFRDERVINNSARLVAWLRSLYPDATPTRHREVSDAPTACPGQLPVEEIWNRATQLLNPTSQNNQGDEPMTNSGDAVNLYYTLLGRTASDEEANIWANKDWKEVYYGIADSDEAVRHRADVQAKIDSAQGLQTELTKEREGYEGQITDLKTQLANDAKVLGIKDNEIARLQKLVDTKPTLPVKKPVWWKAFVSWLSRNGLKLTKKG